MVDYTSNIAGTYAGKGPVVECILDEGAPTYRGTQIMPDGQTINVCSFASPLAEGQVVALSNDVANTYVATEGMPVVERAQTGETLIIGQIVSTPTLKRFPSSTDADDNELTERLAGKYYRSALVEFHVPGRIVAATVATDGTRVLAIGVPTTMHFNIAQAYASGARGYYFDMSADADGVGCIPLTYVASSTDGDLFTALILLTDMLHSDTGA